MLVEHHADRALQEGLGFEQVVRGFGHLDRALVRLPDERPAEHVGVQGAHEYADAGERQAGRHRAPAGIEQHVARQARGPGAVDQPVDHRLDIQFLVSHRLDSIAPSHQRQARQHAGDLLGRARDQRMAREIHLEDVALDERGHRRLLVVAPPCPLPADSRRAGRCRGSARARRPAAAAARPSSRNSTSLPGLSWWLESMNRMSPSPSGGNGRDALNRGCEPFDGQASQTCARLRIDGGDARVEPAVGDRAGEEARRVAGADLDDAPRAQAAHHGVGGGGVEARKPVLVPARRGRRRRADGDEEGFHIPR